MEKLSITIPKPGIEGVDEIAELLGVKEWGGMDGFVLEGRSGRRYSLPALIEAHIKLMREST